MHIFPNAHWALNKIDHERTLRRISCHSLLIAFLVVWSVLYQHLKQNGPHHVRRNVKQCQKNDAFAVFHFVWCPMCLSKDVYLDFIAIPESLHQNWEGGKTRRHIYLTSGVYGHINEMIIIRNEWLTFIVVWNKEFSQSKIGIYCLNECQSQHWMCRINR